MLCVNCRPVFGPSNWEVLHTFIICIKLAIETLLVMVEAQRITWTRFSLRCRPFVGRKIIQTLRLEFFIYAYLTNKYKFFLCIGITAERKGSVVNVEYAWKTFTISSIVSTNLFGIYGANRYLEDVHRLCVLCDRSGNILLCVLVEVWWVRNCD